MTVVRTKEEYDQWVSDVETIYRVLRNRDLLRGSAVAVKEAIQDGLDQAREPEG